MYLVRATLSNIPKQASCQEVADWPITDMVDMMYPPQMRRLLWLVLMNSRTARDEWHLMASTKSLRNPESWNPDLPMHYFLNKPSHGMVFIFILAKITPLYPG